MRDSAVVVTGLRGTLQVVADRPFGQPNGSSDVFVAQIRLEFQAEAL